MSEAVRIYTASGRSILQPRKSAAARSPYPRLIFVLLCACVLVYAFWITRNTHAIEEFIPVNQRFEIFITDLLEKRAELAQSHVWTALPENERILRIPELFQLDVAKPDWVLKNIVGENVYFSGNDLNTFDDGLFVTEMTPVGVLVERAYRLLPGTEHEEAGGLRLRRLSDLDVYYAVRGRIFIASPSRRALVYALTLGPDEHLDHDAIEEAFARSGTEDLRGTMTLNIDDPGGSVFRKVSFAVQLGPREGHVKFVSSFQPEWEKSLSPLLEKARPKPLATPIGGPLEISADFGIPVRELWAALGGLTDFSWLGEDQWRLWENARGQAPEAALTRLLGAQGPGISLTWYGYDLDAIFPVPELAGLIEADKTTVDAYLESLPPSPSLVEEPRAFYDRTTGRFHAPFLGDPGLEATAGWHGDRLLVSSSRVVAEHLLDQSREKGTLPEPGNLYISIDPVACVRRINEAGRLLAENGLLKNFTVASFEELAAERLAKAARIERIWALAQVTGNTVTWEVHLICAAES